MVGGGPLIGREVELAELEAMLSEARLLTVAGAGGCGKTRLALEFADRIDRSERECAIVPLSGVGDEEQLLDALLAALGARERFGATPMQVLVERVASRRLLLVLDNCEHLLAPVGRLAGELLDAAADALVLATSREPLGVPEERVFRLGALGLPDAEDVGALVRSDAARLFVDRAAHSDPAFSLTPSSAPAVASICRQLDGLPLALVLAAARLDALSVEEVARGLSEQGSLATAASAGEPSRHGSLRASLDWSYHLLDERRRALLRRLSVFSEGFTTASARAVASPESREEHVRDDLGALEAKGLIAPAPGKAQERWTLPQSVAEYAAEKLGDAGEQTEMAKRHQTWFGAYAAQADGGLLEADGHERVDRDGANLRRALDHAIGHDPAGALQMAASLMRHWILAEHYQQARSACSGVLSVLDGEADARAVAVLHCGAALVDMLSEDYAEALAGTQAGLRLLADVEEPIAKVQCLLFSSMVLIQTGADLAQGLRNAEQAVELARRAEDPLGLAFALVDLATAAMLCDRFETVGHACDEFLKLPKGREHPRLRTWAEGASAWAEISVGSPERALRHADLALTLEGEQPSMTHFQVLSFRIHALALMGRTDQALAEGAEALRRASESGALQAVPAIELALMIAELMHGNPDAADAHARRLLAMPHLHTLALAQGTLGRIALMRGDAGAARAHAGELETLAERSGSARQRALSRYLRGCADLQARDTDRGRDLLHAALATYAELGLEREAVEALEELALLSASLGETERAARLAAAAAAAHARLQSVPAPAVRERLDAARARLGGGDNGSDGDASRWRAAWGQGEELALEEAIAYARRGRGSRDRPPAGWESLTPVESQVAQLAAEGMSNPQIAARLFISRSTVKLHLSNVYRKLGVANRVELARLAR